MQALDEKWVLKRQFLFFSQCFGVMGILLTSFRRKLNFPVKICTYADMTIHICVRAGNEIS